MNSVLLKKKRFQKGIEQVRHRQDSTCQQDMGHCCINCVPAGQNTPALQATGPRLAKQYDPAGQITAFEFEPGGQEIPARQLVHTAMLRAPAILAKEPPGHGRHTPPVEPYVPGKQGIPAVPASLHIKPTGSPLQRIGGVTRPLNSNEGAVNV